MFSDLFTSCYYYDEIAGGSCLKVLNETTPKKILKDFSSFKSRELVLVSEIPLTIVNLLFTGECPHRALAPRCLSHYLPDNSTRVCL